MFKFIAKLILGTSLLAAFFPPGVPSNPPFPVSGTKVDGYVPTVQADLTVAWEAQSGGAGSTITSPDGTTTITRLPTYNVYDYGASGDYRYAKTSGSNSAAATTINMESGQEAYFKAGQGVAIRGAGAAHALAAVTPTAPTVMVGGQSEFYRVSGNIVEMLNYRKFGDFFGFTSGYTFTADATLDQITTQLPLGVADGHVIYLTNSGGGLPGNTSASTAYYVHLVTGNTNVYTLHTSAANGISGASPVNISSAGTGTHSYWTEISVKCFSTSALPTGLSADTQYWLRPDSSSLRRFTFHPTMADAANNTNVVSLSGAGTGFHSLQMYGGTTINYRVAAWSSNGGQTVRSATGSVTTAPATLRGRYGVNLYWPIVSDGGGTPIYAAGYDVYCDRNGSEHLLCKVGGAPTGYVVVMQAGGYTNCVLSDIGKQVVYSSNFRGKLHAYDNATRTWIIERDYDSGDKFPSGSVCTIQTTSASNSINTNTSGVGAGTSTGTPTWCYICTDGGDADIDYNNRSMARRTGKCTQLVKIAGTPTGGTFQVSLRGYTFNLPYNADANDANTGDVDDFQDAIKYYVPGCQNVSVTSVGTVPNYTYIVTFQDSTPTGMGEVPTMHISDLTSGGTHTISVGTVIQGADYNVGDVIVEPPTSAGSMYEVVETSGLRAGNLDTLTTTQNAITPDGRQVVYQRRDQLSTVASPSAATADLYLGTVSSVDTGAHTITVTPAITTTIADDTPVWHDDRPGIQAAAAAVEASTTGGVLEFPTGYYDLWARDTSQNEWVDSIAGVQPYSLIRLGNRLKSYGWRGNNSTLRFRFTDLNISSNSIGTAGDTSGSSQNPPPTDTQDLANGVVLDLFKCSDFFAERIKFHLIGMADFEHDTLENEGSHVWGASSDDITDNDKERRSVVFRNVTWGGFRSPGTLSSGYGPDSQPLFDNCTLYYGHSAHNSGASEGKWLQGKIERVGRWGSSSFYGVEGYDVKQGLYGTRLVNTGVDGVRTRSANFEWIGGSLIDMKCDECSSENTTTAMLIEPRSRGTKVIGVTFNLQAVIKSQADYTIIDDNNFWNSGVTLDSATVGNYARVTNNTFTATDWIRNASGTCIAISGGMGHVISGNTLDGQTTDTSSSAASQNDGRRTITGLAISGSTTTNLQVGPNTIRATDDAINIASSFVGNVSFTGGYYYSTDYEYNSGNETSILAAGNAAVVTLNGVTIDALTKSDELNVGSGASSARYVFHDCTFLCEGEIATALTTPVTFDDCQFVDATTSWDFLDDGTILVANDFAVAPTLTGALFYTKNNRIAGSAVSSPAALNSGVNALVLPVTDFVRLDPNAANSSLSGMTARASGVEVTTVNVDGGAATLTYTNNSGVTEADEYLTSTAADIGADSVNKSRTWWYDGTTGKWRDK